VPNQYRHLSVLEVRFAAWDLTQVHLVDPHTGTVLCRLFPQDKAANASGRRRGLQPIAVETAKPSSPTSSPPPARGIGPLLARMIDRQAATGLPPAYLPKDEGDEG
jgi:putative transposase